MIDLEETNRIKKAIDNNPQDYRDIIEASNLAICITDENGNFWEVNANYCRLYGYEREELIGQSFLLVVPEQRKKELEGLHNKFIEIQEEIFRTWEVVNKSGEIIKISVDAGFTKKINGKPQKLTFVKKAE